MRADLPNPAAYTAHHSTSPVLAYKIPDMAYAQPRLGYHQARSESKHSAYFEEDDSAVLDPAILDADIMQSPNSAHFRKDSFANSSGVLSPPDSHGWDQQYGGLSVDPVSAGAANSYHEDNNGFVLSLIHI